MEKISIISLIYQSIEYAEFVYSSVMKYTPEIVSGEAEFYFVANDASDEVLNFLDTKNYPYYVNNNSVYTEEELFNMGHAYPEYINRVYRGYNFGIKVSNNPILVLINSDNYFSPNWLKNLKSKLNHNVVVGTKIVQPHHAFVSPKNGSRCEVYDCGLSINSFNENLFIEVVKELTHDSISVGNLFMPLMLYKEQVELVGYYPEGNIHNGAYNRIKITGDHAFINKLEANGIKHITSNNSIVYHFQEGEKNNKI